VSVPAPREMICFFWSGLVFKNDFTKRSMAVVRTYVPVTGQSRYSYDGGNWTSIDDGESFGRCVSLVEEFGKAIVQIAHITRTKPRSSSILICVLDNSVS